MSNKLNQKGFGAVETLLIIVIIAIIGGTGYYVYHANQKTNNTYNTAAKVAQSSPAKGSVKKVASSQSSQKYFTIKEWNVEAPYNGTLNLSYKITTAQGAQIAKFTSSNLVADKCDGGFGGEITRELGSASYGGSIDSAPETVQAAVQNGDLTTYSHVGNYYYVADRGGNASACSAAPASTTDMQASIDAVGNIAQNLKTY